MPDAGLYSLNRKESNLKSYSLAFWSGTRNGCGDSGARRKVEELMGPGTISAAGKVRTVAVLG